MTIEGSIQRRGVVGLKIRTGLMEARETCANELKHPLVILSKLFISSLMSSRHFENVSPLQDWQCQI